MPTTEGHLLYLKHKYFLSDVGSYKVERGRLPGLRPEFGLKGRLKGSSSKFMMLPSPGYNRCALAISIPGSLSDGGYGNVPKHRYGGVPSHCTNPCPGLEGPWSSELDS